VLDDATIRRALTSGKFRIVAAKPEFLVLRRRGLTVFFYRMDPHAAVRAFRRGKLDEAPVPQGEIRATEADPTLSSALRARELNGVDVIVLPPTLPRGLVSAYRLTVPRGDYQSLISERVAPPAYALTREAEPPSAAQVRAARGRIRDLPSIPITLGVPDRPELVEAAEIVWAEWRQLGFPVRLTRSTANADARFVRLIPPVPSEGQVVPLGWVAEARLVSPRVRGWAMDELGVVDYTKVSLEAGA
jgi:hypothetical protein